MAPRAPAWIYAAGAVAVAAGIWWIVPRTEPGSSGPPTAAERPAGAPTPEPSGSATEAPALSPDRRASSPVRPSPSAPQAAMSPAAASPGKAGGPAEAREQIELDKVNRMLRDYRTLTGENPVGTNAEIMEAIMGGNPRHARLGPPEGQNLNAQGELLDSWGTPYFFHQLSGQEMEIHSAGPDRVLGTPDDLVWH